ncbi:glycosyltransferase [Streptomyces pluripotens]|uniref:Glycosyltransferase n=1 Tax=Streptomyces pluripotens TaxID=1355015 RepID=A0A221P0R5_9ACTN|nr:MULTISPECIES: peptidoglycan-binding protein [Streptomyces]ARP71576.1 hypothetical protein LK06_018325 [Streptomyces pluripotens]ASN25827.1 glycosyltransferase [Streptomyces pluripotens]MCH0557498.1 peptidoglycan-binding protein [Streptomyces sp. MUM 16J]
MSRSLVAFAAAAALALGATLAGAGTASAARNYQYCGITYSAAEPQLGYGSTGAAVKALQCQLNFVMAGPALKVDGIFGGLTYNAVVKFQGCTGLDKDGIVGPKTWGELDVNTDLPLDLRHVC